MRNIIDFETYCDLDIKKVGLYKYAEHPSCRILCMSYKKDDGEVRLWTPDMPQLPPLEGAIYAFSAAFEHAIWNIVGHRDYPDMFPLIPVSRFVDIKAICARYRLPQNLKQAGIALKCDTEKMAIGEQLIKVCCTPLGNPTPEHFAQLYEYCRVDTEVAYQIIQKLPADHLTEKEQKLWELTVRINKRGIPIDIESVYNILKYLAVYMEEMKTVLPEVTNGMVKTAGQIQKIKEFCLSRGVDLPDLRADTVDEYLDKGLPEDVKTVLEIRKIMGLTSVKKFIVMKEMYNKGVVQDCLVYHRAGTGRWAGQGLQYHNLPRAKVDNPEEWIAKFNNKEPIEKPIKIAKALIRPMICAPEGYKLMVADYKSIENRGLAWLSDDQDALQLFKDGRCQYSDMAAFLYGVPVESIEHKSPERFMGKTIILGCGYQMGKERFQGTAKGYGINITLQESELAVKAYRAKYPKVVRLWNEYVTAAMAAVRYPGKMFIVGKCEFRSVSDRTHRKWLRITLPSGRGMMYANPVIKDSDYGAVVKYKGINPTTYQYTEIALTPGLITENICQGMCRDILSEGMLTIDEHLLEVKIVLSVHDEIGALAREEYCTDLIFSQFKGLMCITPKWAEGMPIEADGYMDKRYRKD